MIFGDILTSSSLGTGTTKTQINGAAALVLPADCKSILAVIPEISVTTPTAAEFVAAKLELESDDFQIIPYAILFPTAASQLGKGGLTIVTNAHKWPVNVRVNGGDRIKGYGTALVANTSAPLGSASLILSDMPVAETKIHGSVGTLTATGTGTGETAGTAYTFTGGTKLIEVYGVIHSTTVAAAKPMIGYVRFSSSEFAKSVPMRFMVRTAQAAISTDATTASQIHAVTQILRYNVDVGLKSPTTIQDYYNLEQAVTTAGKFVTGTLWI